MTTREFDGMDDYNDDLNQEYEYIAPSNQGINSNDRIELHRLREAEEKRLSALNNRRNHSSKYKVYTKITAESLSLLYGVSIRTIKRWIKNKRLDPTDIKDIIRVYNTRLCSKEWNSEKVQ